MESDSHTAPYGKAEELRVYLDTSNFTGVLTNDNRDTLLTVIEKLLALPIVTNEDIENRVMGRTPGSMNYSQELKKHYDAYSKKGPSLRGYQNHRSGK